MCLHNIVGETILKFVAVLLKKKKRTHIIERQPCSHVILEIMYSQPAVQSHLLRTESTGI